MKTEEIHHKLPLSQGGTHERSNLIALCRSCRANVLVMEVIRQGLWKLSERIRLCSAVRQLGWVCKVLLLVDENADELLASEVRQTVKDQLADGFIYASVSPTYLAGVIDTL